MRTPTTSSQLSRRLWLLFVVFIVYGTTIPFRFTTDWAAVASKWSHVSLNPIRASGGGRPSISDAVQNILFFLPFGALGVLARRPTSRSIVPRIAMVTGLAALLSIAVEGAQLFTADRITSATDVATDTLGALLGAIAAHVTGRLSMRSLRALVGAGLVDVQAFFPFFVAALVVGAAAWEPFDVTIDVGTVAHKIRALQHDVWQYGGVSDAGISVIHYALFTVACSTWLHTLGVRRAAFVAMLAGLPLAVALEASQVMISSRTPGLEDATIAVSGVVLGALLWRVGQRVRAPWAWLALLVAATAVAAAMEMLSPFEIAHDRRLFNWLPFMGYYAFTTFQTLSHVLEIWLLYFPLGFGCGLVVKKPVPAMVTAGIVTFVIAAPVEYGQGWIVGRYPDVTDIAMSVVGGWLGAWAATAGAAMFDEVVASLRGS